MLDHLFVSSHSGALYDTRAANWSYQPPLRPNFKLTHARIATVADFKATLRAGPYAWPGGYPLYLLCDDGGVLCFSCARKEARNVIDSIHHQANADWCVVACDVNYEDNHLHCDHCSEKIEAAYGED